MFVGVSTSGKNLAINMHHRWSFGSGKQWLDLANEKIELFTCLKFAERVYECVL